MGRFAVFFSAAELQTEGSHASIRMEHLFDPFCFNFFFFFSSAIYVAT